MEEIYERNKKQKIWKIRGVKEEIMEKYNNETIKKSNEQINKKNKKNKKSSRGLMIAGIVIGVLQLIVSVVFMVMVHILGMIPATYEILIGILLLLFVALTLVTQRWKVVGVLTKILAVLLSAILVFGSVILGVTHNAVSKMSGENTVTSTLCVYVMADSEYSDIKSLDGTECGKMTLLDKEHTQSFTDKISKDENVNLQYKEYLEITQLVDGLYAGEVEAIIFNNSYLGILEEIDNYKNFASKTKCIYTEDYVTKIETEAKNDNEESTETNDNVIAIYVSGIDAREGSVTSNANSDVNILCLVNTKTHQMLMINTPRDFYVPLSISNGVKDKLTHAGCYGIKCSVDTLDMLYDIDIDYYVKVNFTGFVTIIDMLGGVDVYSEYAFSTTSYGNYTYQKGYNYMNGDQALAFARERHAFGSGDRQRGKNQMAVIEAVVKKATTSTAMLTNYTNILNSVSSSVATDMPYSVISKLVQQQLKDMAAWDIQQYSVDGTGDNLMTFSLSSPNYVMVPNEKTVAQAKSYIKQMYNDEIVKVSK